MVAELEGAATPEPTAGPLTKTYCGPRLRLKPPTAARHQHCAESIRWRRQVLNVTTWIGSAISLSFAVTEVVTTGGYGGSS